jgi:hypothetical protein
MAAPKNSNVIEKHNEIFDKISMHFLITSLGRKNILLK